MLQKVKRWITGNPLTISNVPNTGQYPSCVQHEQIDLNFGQRANYNLRMRIKERIRISSKIKNDEKCYYMLLINLAEPDWFSLPCDDALLSYVICVRDKSRNTMKLTKMESVKNNYFCAANAILVNDACYEFFWTSALNKADFAKGKFKGDIMTFKHIFESIALENKILSVFSQKTISQINVLKFVRYLDTVTFENSIGSVMDTKGYIISTSQKFVINIDIHTFKCKNGSYILYKFICDGIINCIDDRSDEEHCNCNRTQTLKTCKFRSISKYLLLCSSTYYMNKNGECMKYASPDKIYQELHINYNFQKSNTIKMSKLSASETPENISKLNRINERELVSALKFMTFSVCLNPGELPCWEGYNKCYKLKSLCIYELDTDNTLLPCGNGRHLHHCKEFSCDAMFKCVNHYCIPWSYTCDGKWDCPKGYDEMDFWVCNKDLICENMYHCRNTLQKCLHLGNTCDGHIDCPLGDDEVLCEMKSVICPSSCVCLLYAIECKSISFETAEGLHTFHYLSIFFSNFQLTFNLRLIMKFKYAVVLKLPKNHISDICNVFNKLDVLMCILLDLSFNLLRAIKNKCFSKAYYLQSLAINNNKIEYLEQYSFHALVYLKFLNLTSNPIIHMHRFLIHDTKLKILSVMNVSLKNIKPDLFGSIKTNIILTKNYHLCCTVKTGVVCMAYQPWYISCSDMLPSSILKLFYVSISILIIVLNILSIALQINAFKTSKMFTIVIISVNINDILCGIYLCLIWIADLSHHGSFHVKEELWRSGLLCLTAFTTILWFTVLTEFVLIFMSLTRLMITMYPLETKFKETKFIVKSLVFSILCSLLFSTCIALVFKIAEKYSTLSLCLPFIDPTHSQLIIKFITYVTTGTQFGASITIVIMHILLIIEVRKFQKEIKKCGKESNVALITQLLLVTLSNILCWFPAGCVYISAIFLSTYPIDLVIWTTVIGVPVNSFINPFIFIVTTVRKMNYLKSKVTVTVIEAGI